jgi:hypothetical protein
VSISDRIVEAGPFSPGQVLPPELVQDIFKTGELNALHAELVQLRQLRAAAAKADYDQCGCLGGILSEWQVSSRAELAELEERAAEHTEVCR